MQRHWTRTIRQVTASAAMLVTLAGCGTTGSPVQPFAGSGSVDLVKRGPGGTTRFLGHNVVYRLDPQISMVLSDMNADIVLKDPTLPFVPANKGDYAIAIHHAVIDKKASSLAALMNNYVFADADSPLKGLKLGFKGDRLVMAGKMKKLGVWTAFEMEGVVDPTPDGKIRMTPKVIKSMGLQVNGLLSFFGIEMSKLLKTKEEKGLTINGNEIIMDPSKMYPPPTLMGRVTAVGVRNNMLHIEFDDGHAKPWPDMPVANPKACMVMWGGDVLINAVLNLNAKMEILDASPSSPMLFAIDRYREQLEAGFVVPTRAGHLIAYVPDVTNFDVDMGRFAPPSFPIPGMNPAPLDIDPADLPMPEGYGSSQQDSQQPSASSRR